MSEYEVYLVGSVLTSPAPGDIDLVMVMDDWKFFDTFEMTPLEFIRMLNTGEWDSRMDKWSSRCVSISKTYEQRMATSLSVDLKIMPRSYSDLYRRWAWTKKEENR